MHSSLNQIIYEQLLDFKSCIQELTDYLGSDFLKDPHDLRLYKSIIDYIEATKMYAGGLVSITDPMIHPSMENESREYHRKCRILENEIRQCLNEGVFVLPEEIKDRIYEELE